MTASMEDVSKQRTALSLAFKLAQAKMNKFVQFHPAILSQLVVPIMRFTTV